MLLTQSNGRVSMDAVVVLLVAAMLAAPAAATTLQDTLSNAYQNNATLQAQRAMVAATQDDASAIYSGWKPTVALNASVGRTRLDGQFSSLFGAFSSPGSPSIMPIKLRGSAVGVQFSQPLYHGGHTNASIGRAHAEVAAQRARLRNTEQRVFLDAARAYINVLTDRKVLLLERHNVTVLGKQLDSARANRQAGAATRTDVAQSKAHLAGARAKVIQAKGDIRKARAAYQRIVGVTAKNIESLAKPTGLPATFAEALQRASQNYPVIVARYAMQAAQDNVDVQRGRFSPSIDLTGSYTHANDPQFAFAQLDRAEIALTVSIPIYQGGALESHQSSAHHRAAQRRHQLIAAQRRARQNVTDAWQAYQTSKAVLAAIESQISAAQIAFRGVRNEHRVGERTQLDVLNAQQDLLAARVRRARDKGNMYIAAYALRAATGRLTAKDVLKVAAHKGG